MADFTEVANFHFIEDAQSDGSKWQQPRWPAPASVSVLDDILITVMAYHVYHYMCFP